MPLNTPVTYAQTGHFALITAQALERAHPQLIVTDMAKVRRTGKVFIDWSQNSDYKTTVSVYSLRAKRHQPFVSLPIRWDELERVAKNADSLYFDAHTALRRLADVGDLFRPVLRLKQRLPQASGTGHGRPRSGSTSRFLDTYAAKFPRGSFGQEALVLRIRAIDQAGDSARATALAKSFVARFPNSPHVARLKPIAERGASR